MKKLKIIISNLLWKIAGISPEWGNKVMDILGYDNYCKVAKYQKSKGHVLLNDVYESIGLSRILEYYDIGWLYNEENPVGDNFIDFGIYNLSDLINSMPDEIIIDFNVDGVIRY